MSGRDKSTSGQDRSASGRRSISRNTEGRRSTSSSTPEGPPGFHEIRPDLAAVGVLPSGQAGNTWSSLLGETDLFTGGYAGGSSAANAAGGQPDPLVHMTGFINRGLRSTDVEDAAARHVERGGPLETFVPPPNQLRPPLGQFPMPPQWGQYPMPPQWGQYTMHPQWGQWQTYMEQPFAGTGRGHGEAGASRGHGGAQPTPATHSREPSVDRGSNAPDHTISLLPRIDRQGWE